LQPHGIFPQGPIYRDLSIEPHFYCFEAKVTDSSSPHTVLLFHAASVNLEDINLLYGWTRVNYFGWTIFHRPTAAITSTELEYIFTDLHRLRLNPPLH
jgi:hypothetical protein